MKILTFTNIFLLLVLFLVLMILEYQSNSKDVVLPIVIQLYGSFIAIFLGIYLPLAEAKKKETQEEQRRMVASLKLIWSELDINEMVMKNVLHGLQTMPRRIEQLYDNSLFVLNTTKDVVNGAYYGSISSGTMNKISEHDDIFNSLQQAYFNTHLTVRGLNSTAEVYKEYDHKNPATIPANLQQQAMEILDKEIEKAKSAIAFIATAKRISGEYLAKRGVTFSQGALT